MCEEREVWDIMDCIVLNSSVMHNVLFLALGEVHFPIIAYHVHKKQVSEERQSKREKS